MKKKILFLGLLLVSIFMITGCGNKKAISTREFINITEQDGLTTVDVKDQFSDESVVEATIAYNDDYKLEFYILNSEASAKSMFSYNKNIFESRKSGISKYASTDIGNSSTYMLQSGGYYMYLSRIDNTLLYVSVSEQYKDNVKEVIKDLGY